MGVRSTNTKQSFGSDFYRSGFEAALPPPGPVYSDDVFSTYIPETATNDQPLNIDNGIDFATHGGLIWLKRRNGTASTYTQHALIDTERNADTALLLPSANGNTNNLTSGSSFDSDGFTWASENNFHPTGADYVSWSFRKQPGFFTIKTWAGDGEGDRFLDHDLGSIPGFVIVKNLTDSQDWGCYHRSLGTLINGGLTLNENYESGNASVLNPIRTTPTASQIHIRGAANEYNTLNKNYVAYIFAHDDQRFGTGKDESIIKCDTWTSSSGEATVNLGWEPQFVLTKNVTTTGVWQIFDTMRGMPVGDTDPYLSANSGGDEQSTNNFIDPLPNGFKVNNMGTTQTFAYIAIRRPHKPITVPTKLFTVGGNTSSEPEYVSNFVVDMAFHRNLGTNLQDDTAIFSRLTGVKALLTNSTASETTPNAINQFDFMDGWGDNQANNSNYKSWMFRRAPGFFDVVTYSGQAPNAQPIPHNLGVIPELILIKSRTSLNSWAVYSSTLGEAKYLMLDDDAHETSSTTAWNNTSPTSTTFTVGDLSNTNQNNQDFIAYLFATLPGVSKVGTYAGTGGVFNVDCGFSNSARFVLIKRTDQPSGGNTAGWRVYDTSQGIVDDGIDPYFELDNQDPQITNNDGIDRYQNGFALTGSGNFEINANGGTYIYLAIA